MALFKTQGSKAPLMSVSQEGAAHILKMILLEEADFRFKDSENILDDKEELEAIIQDDILTEGIAEELVEYKPADKAELMAIYIKAEEADDEDFKKLVTAMAAVDELNKRLIDKYKSEASQVVADVAEKGSESSSEVISEACKKYLLKRR